MRRIAPSLVTADFKVTNRFQRSSRWWCRQALLHHEVVEKLGCLWMWNRRLRTDPNQAVRVVDRQPLTSAQTPSDPAAAIIPGIEFGTGIGEKLHHRVSTFVTGAVQSRAPIVASDVRVEAELEQPSHRFDVVALRPLLSNPFDPSDP